jgi:DNA-binding Xre family transcriptional regulator
MIQVIWMFDGKTQDQPERARETNDLSLANLSILKNNKCKAIRFSR